jgi:hypothetical protein
LQSTLSPVNLAKDLLEYAFAIDYTEFNNGQRLIHDVTLEFLTINWYKIYPIIIENEIHLYIDSPASMIANVLGKTYPSTGLSIMEGCLSDNMDFYIKQYRFELENIFIHNNN